MLKGSKSNWAELNEANLIHDFPLMPEIELKKRYGKSTVQEYKKRFKLQPKHSYGFFKQKNATTSNKLTFTLDEPYVDIRPKFYL